MKVLIVEQLNHRILSQHSSIVADADVCLSISVSHGSAAEQALGDARWQVVSLPAHERAIARHAAWAHELAMSQRLGDRPLPARYESLVCYGLEFRLRPAALALAFLKETAKARGCSLDQIEVRIVADDPYLRDAFTRPDGIAAQLKSVALRSSSRPAAVVGTLKEQLAASRMVRRLALAWAGGTLMRSPWPLGKRQTTNRKRTAALFVLSQHYRDLFQPIRALLISRGWRVPVFCYNPIEDSGNDAELFDDAVRKTGGGLNEALVTPEWNISVNFLRESPVSSRWLRVVLDASWLTGWDKILRHQRVLSSLQPNVVISYSLDTMGLGLRGAADSLGIPSLFINHGPQGPVPSSWIFRWTASALAGQPCVAANTVDPFSIRHSGLVAVGYPPYDAILARAAALGDRRSEIASLGQPAERPYVVVVFAEYGSLFWVHALQDRLLRLVAEVLPSDCFLVCKLHPAGEHERDLCEKVLGSLLPSDAFAVIGERQHTTPDLLAACHVAVAVERCMALTDAIFMRRPAVGIRFPEIPPGSNDLKHPARGPEFWKCCRVVRDKTEMRDALISLTRNATARAALLKSHKRYIEQFYLASDGRASHRVADLIEHLGEGKDAESFVPTIGTSLLVE